DIAFLLILNEDSKVETAIQSISKSIHSLGRLYLNQEKMTSFDLGIVNGFYGFGENSLSDRLAKQASILSSEPDKYRSLVTSLIKGICLWLKLTFNDRGELYKLDQEKNLVLFHYLYSLSETMLKILLELTDEKTDCQLRYDVYEVVNREIIALCEIREDKEVLRRIDTYGFMS
ncbi:hypothetical protein P3549_24790, partial [Vibrio parahaemolyticus]|nr:hypothetical protein [Vibrio parahaemolyticus]